MIPCFDNILQVGNYVTTGNFKNPQRGRIYSIYGLCPTLNTASGGGHIPRILIGGRIRRLTPIEHCRLMGLREKEIEALKRAKLSDQAIYQLTGNSIVVEVLEGIFSQLFINTEKQQQTLF